MSDTEIFMKAVGDHTDRVEKAISGVHEKMNSFCLKQVEINTRMEEHAKREDIHKSSDCEKCLVSDHEKGHTDRVKSDLGSIIGRPVLAALLLLIASAAVAGISGAFG